MRKQWINKDILSEEMRLAAQKRIPFKRVWENLQRDYNIQMITPVQLDQIRQHYNTLLFICEERKNRYGIAG